jgi:hypothetical protein
VSAEYATLALEALGRTPVARLLEQLPEGQAFVLERIARGGGGTSWYVIRTSDDLQTLAERLRPGSLVSFYFDDRLIMGAIDGEARAAILEIAVRDTSAVVGAVDDSDIELTVDFPSSATELDEFVTEHEPATFAFGAFPASENDGSNAVTLTLPDADGVMRPHPH